MKTTGQSLSSKVLENVGTAGLPGDGAPRQVGLVVLYRAASHDPRPPHRRLPDVQVWRKEGTIKHPGKGGKEYKDNDTSLNHTSVHFESSILTCLSADKYNVS